MKLGFTLGRLSKRSRVSQIRAALQGLPACDIRGRDPQQQPYVDSGRRQRENATDSDQHTIWS
jgi:hypothetical protein